MVGACTNRATRSLLPTTRLQRACVPYPNPGRPLIHSILSIYLGLPASRQQASSTRHICTKYPDVLRLKTCIRLSRLRAAVMKITGKPPDKQMGGRWWSTNSPTTIRTAHSPFHEQHQCQRSEVPNATPHTVPLRYPPVPLSRDRTSRSSTMDICATRPSAGQSNAFDTPAHVPAPLVCWFQH